MPGELQLSGSIEKVFRLRNCSATEFSPCRWAEERKRKYAKWQGKKDEKEKKKSFKAKKEQERKAHKAAVKKIVADEKARKKNKK